jgi:MFS family permease
MPAWRWRAALPAAVNALLLLVTVPFGSLIFAALGRLALSAGFSTRVGVATVTLMALFNGVGRFAGGWLSDVTSAPTARTVMLACAAAGYGVLLVSTHGHGTAAWFLALPVLAGFAFGGLAGKLPALAAYTSTARATEVFSLYFGVFALGSFGRPLLSAALGFETALTLCGVMAWAGLVVSLILPRLMVNDLSKRDQ